MRKEKDYGVKIPGAVTPSKMAKASCLTAVASGPDAPATPAPRKQRHARLPDKHRSNCVPRDRLRARRDPDARPGPVVSRASLKWAWTAGGAA